MLQQLLRDNDDHQFHLVKLEAPDEDDSSASSHRGAAAASSRSSASSGSSFTPSLRLDSSMSLGGVINFKWKFQCHSYGSALDQCTFLRNQMYLPLHEMVKILSFQLEREKQKNLLLVAGGSDAPAAAAAAGGRGGPAHHRLHHHAAAAGGDVSLSLSLPSLASAEREAHLAALGGAAALQSFDAFSSAFHFSKAVGPLYVGVVNRLSGNEDGLGLDPAPPSASQPPASWEAPSQRPHSPNFEMEQEEETSRGRGRGGAAAAAAAADRRRGMKRDRSPSPAPAAAAAHPYRGGVEATDRDPDLDYKHQDEDGGGGGGGGYSPSMPQASFDAGAMAASGAAGSASFQASLDIGGHVDEEGVYRESEAERVRREALQKQLADQKKKKKKKTFV